MINKNFLIFTFNLYILIKLRNLLKDVNPKAYQQVFFSYLKYGELYSISNSTEKIDTLNDLYRFRIICFSGIANSSLMVNYLKEYSAEVRHLNFSDHHEYSIKDLEDIENYEKENTNIRQSFLHGGEYPNYWYFYSACYFNQQLYRPAIYPATQHAHYTD